MPFAKDLKEGDPSHSGVLNNDVTCDCMWSTLHLDREIPFLSLLKREGVAKQMKNYRINVGKKGAKLTECG